MIFFLHGEHSPFRGDRTETLQIHRLTIMGQSWDIPDMIRRDTASFHAGATALRSTQCVFHAQAYPEGSFHSGSRLWLDNSSRLCANECFPLISNRRLNLLNLHFDRDHSHLLYTNLQCTGCNKDYINVKIYLNLTAAIWNITVAIYREMGELSIPADRGGAVILKGNLLQAGCLRHWRREPDLNRRIKVLQTFALPLGYHAAGL